MEQIRVSLSQDKKTLTVELAFSEAGTPSASGKGLVHATTRGNVQTSLILKGKPLIIGLNAYTKVR